MKMINKGLSIFLVVSLIVTAFSFFACSCLSPRADVLFRHVLKASHDCCCPPHASNCGFKVFQTFPLFQPVQLLVTGMVKEFQNWFSSLRISRSETSETSSFSQAISLHLLSPGVTIPQAFFPKNQVLRI